MQLGPYRCSAIHTGTLWLDGGAMFGTLPRVVWEKLNPPDSKHRVELAMRALLLEGEGRKILVDCGVGEKGGEKFKELFNVNHSIHQLDRSLKEKNLTRADITDVVLTHLHFDHAGGATVRLEDGTYSSAFPNAVYHLQKRNLEVAMHPNLRERASYLPEIFEALVQEKRISLLNGPTNLFPEVKVQISNGHTEAQQHLMLTDGQKTLFYGGDLFPTSTHVPLAWIMGYDLHPLKMLEEKEHILSMARNEKLIIFYEHDPKIAASTVIEGKKGWVAGDAIEF